MKFKEYSEQALPPQAEIDEAHNEMLHNFIKTSEGLRSMLLIGVRPTDNDMDAVEVSCGATSGDMFRAAASILEAIVAHAEAIVAHAPENLKGSEQIETLKKVISVIYHLAGDDPDEVVRQNLDSGETIN